MKSECDFKLFKKKGVYEQPVKKHHMISGTLSNLFSNINTSPPEDRYLAPMKKPP